MKIILSVMVFNISKQKNKSKTCLMGDSFVLDSIVEYD